MRLREGLIAGRSHLFFVALLVGLFFLLQWLDQLETSQGAGQADGARIETVETKRP